MEDFQILKVKEEVQESVNRKTKSNERQIGNNLKEESNHGNMDTLFKARYQISDTFSDRVSHINA